MAANHAPRIKNGDLHGALVATDDSPGQAARIANAHAAGLLHHHGVRREDRTAAALREETRRIGIAGRSPLTRPALIAAIRGHG